MIRVVLIAGLAALAAGCSTTASTTGSSVATRPGPAASGGLTVDPLQRADQEMAAARYRDAVALYEEFVRANPQHPAAVRARAAQGALSALLETQGERDRLRTDLTAREADIARLRQELGTRTTESAGRTAEVTRLRRDLDARQAEVDRLKADLDRLRSIDLRREPSRR